MQTDAHAEARKKLEEWTAKLAEGWIAAWVQMPPEAEEVQVRNVSEPLILDDDRWRYKNGMSYGVICEGKDYWRPIPPAEPVAPMSYQQLLADSEYWRAQMHKTAEERNLLQKENDDLTERLSRAEHDLARARSASYVFSELHAEPVAAPGMSEERRKQLESYHQLNQREQAEVFAEVDRQRDVIAEKDARIAELEQKIAELESGKRIGIAHIRSLKDELAALHVDERRLVELNTLNQHLHDKLTALRASPKATTSTAGGTTIVNACEEVAPVPEPPAVLDPKGTTRNYADVIRAKMKADPRLAAAVELAGKISDLEVQLHDMTKPVAEPFVSEGDLSGWESYLRAQAGVNGYARITFGTLEKFLKEIRRLQSENARLAALVRPVSVDTGAIDKLKAEIELLRAEATTPLVGDSEMVEVYGDLKRIADKAGVEVKMPYPVRMLLRWLSEIMRLQAQLRALERASWFPEWPVVSVDTGEHGA